MNVLLTGASGFIGCRLLANLEQAGHTIRLISRKSIGQYDQVICDFTSDKVPHKALEGVDTVYHLASFAHDLREASGNEHVYRTVNLDTTVRLAELAVAAKAQRFIFVSSVKAGGRLILGRCANENDQNKSVGIYGRTKQQAEVELLKIGKKSGMHVSIIRPSLVYGPRMKGNLAVMQAGVKKGWFPALPNIRDMIC